MRLCDEFLNWVKAEFQQIYIFTLLACLYYIIIHLIATGEFDLKPEVESLLNQGSGGIIAMMTVIVQSIFSKSPQRARAGDTAPSPLSPDPSPEATPVAPKP